MGKDINGKILVKHIGLNVAHALYRESGNYYHLLKKFPGVLFDNSGYVLFKTEAEYKKSEHLDITNKIQVKGGISKMPQYIKDERIKNIFLELSNNIDDSTDYIEIKEGIASRQDVSTNSRSKPIVRRRLVKDDFTCQSCGFKMHHKNKYVIDCHHIKPINNGERNTVIEDLVSLCPTCHRIAHLKKPVPYSVKKIKDIREKELGETPLLITKN